MENSPPGIHVMPSSEFAGGCVLLGTVAVNSCRVEAVIAAASEGAFTKELTEGDEMPAEEAVSEENFEMAMPVMAKMGKATKVHGNTLCNFELAAITSLFDFGIKSPRLHISEQLPSCYAGIFLVCPQSRVQSS
jgi:hypothetical protein